MFRHRVCLLILAAILAASLPLLAQRRFAGGAGSTRPNSGVAARPFVAHGGFAHRPVGSHSGFGRFGSRFAFGTSFGFGYGYPLYSYPYYYPLLPPLLPPQPQYTNVIVTAEQPSPYWFPPPPVITGPFSVMVIYGNDQRVIGMGVPSEYQPDSEPLGDIARRYRMQAAQTRSGQRYVLRIEK